MLSKTCSDLGAIGKLTCRLMGFPVSVCTKTEMYLPETRRVLKICRQGVNRERLRGGVASIGIDLWAKQSEPHYPELPLLYLGCLSEALSEVCGLDRGPQRCSRHGVATQPLLLHGLHGRVCPSFVLFSNSRCYTCSYARLSEPDKELWPWLAKKDL